MVNFVIRRFKKIFIIRSSNLTDLYEYSDHWTPCTQKQLHFYQAHLFAIMSSLKIPIKDPDFQFPFFFRTTSWSVNRGSEINHSWLCSLWFHPGTRLCPACGEGEGRTLDVVERPSSTTSSWSEGNCAQAQAHDRPRRIGQGVVPYLTISTIYGLRSDWRLMRSCLWKNGYASLNKARNWHLRCIYGFWLLVWTQNNQLIFW